MDKGYRVKGKKVVLELDEDLIAVRFREPAPYSMRAAIAAKPELGAFTDRIEMPKEKYTIFNVAQNAKPRHERFSEAVNAVNTEKSVYRVNPVFKSGNSKMLATDRIMVGLNENIKDVKSFFDQYRGKILHQYEDEYLVQLEENDDPFEICAKLDKSTNVNYAEPDFVTIGKYIEPHEHFKGSTGSDPFAEKQYAIRITRAFDAWKLQMGDPEIKIAIIDIGIDISHEDLAPVVVGTYDAVENDEYQEPMPWDAHGTACAGLAVGVHNNNAGIKGIGAGCSLLAVKAGYSWGKDTNRWRIDDSWVSRAIDWSWQNDADIISISLNWRQIEEKNAVSNALARALTRGRKGKGCVIVVSAGNDGPSVAFPGNLDKVITVSASNEFDEPKTRTSSDGESWWTSNFGPEIDVAAPGVHNYTTDIPGKEGYTSSDYISNFSGTSSAAPIVAGAAGLILSADKNLTEAEVRQIIKDTADQAGSIPYVNGRNDYMGSGRLNVLNAVRVALGFIKPIEGVIKSVIVPDSNQIGAFALVTTDGDSYLLRTYQGTETMDWEIMEQQSLEYFSRFQGKKVLVHYKRRQNSKFGNILWGVSVSQ